MIGQVVAACRDRLGDKRVIKSALVRRWASRIAGHMAGLKEVRKMDDAQARRWLATRRSRAGQRHGGCAAMIAKMLGGVELLQAATQADATAKIEKTSRKRSGRDSLRDAGKLRTPKLRKSGVLQASTGLL